MSVTVSVNILAFDIFLFAIIYYYLLKMQSTLPLWKLAFKTNGIKDCFILLILASIIHSFIEKLLLLCYIVGHQCGRHDLTPFIVYFRGVLGLVCLICMDRICRKILPNMKGRFSGYVSLEYLWLDLLLVFIKSLISVMALDIVDSLYVRLYFRNGEIVEFLDEIYERFYLSRASPY